MNLLACYTEIKPIITIIGWVVFLIQVGIPIILIILGMLDLGKAVIASKEDEIKKAKKAFGQRFLYAAAVFLVVWAVKLVMGFIPTMFGDADVSNTTSWQGCWSCIASRGVESTDQNEGCHFENIK